MGDSTLDRYQNLQIVQSKESPDDNVYFGYLLPYLPDFLTDHTLLGNTYNERLSEILDRFERFVIGLRKYVNTAYSLRFISNPLNGSVDISILGRLTAPRGKAIELGLQVANDLSIHLSSFGFSGSPLLSGQIQNASPLISTIQHPFSGTAALVEIRQHETVVPFMTVSDKAAYVIHPYWGAVGSCLEPFESLLHQSVPVAINIHLEPTEVTNEEYQALSEAAHIAHTVADLDVRTYSAASVHRRRDPGAELVSRIYSSYQNSLAEPFIVVVQTASPDANASWTIARAYASAILGRTYRDSNKDIDRGLPSDVDIVAPSNKHDYQSAWRTFSDLIWSPWGESQASKNKERMPYLAGARGASTAFRFPISVKGGIPGVAVRQSPPDFEPGPRPNKVGPDEIHLGSHYRGGTIVFSKQDLTRHVLITGFTGSGKTNTVLHILTQLWNNHRIPFLVIEAAKKEYRALSRVKGFEELLIFTLGDETTAPFRFNPFELMPGMRVEAHIGRLQACFDAALPQLGILPSIVAEALEEVYKTKSWKLTDRNTDPDRSGLEEGKDMRLFPTLQDMYREVIRVSERRGYAGEILHNIRAAAAGRIGNLLRGSRGRMFSVQRSLPAAMIFHRPVILELNDLNEDDKALTMMLLLMWLREYRELNSNKKLQHVTVVEEAHNVISNVQSVGNSEIAADTKAKAVLAFANILSEVRAFGEGIVISDQSPEKLAPDAMRNTNLQIAHQLRDRRDREAIARAMIMDKEQQEYLGKLRVGEAALFLTGIEKATFIKIPECEEITLSDSLPSDEEVSAHMNDLQSQNPTIVLPFDGCRFCKSQCWYREAVEPFTLHIERYGNLRHALSLFNEKPKQEHWPSHWRAIAKVCSQVANQAGYPDKLDAAYCYLVQEIDFLFTQHMRRSFETAYAEDIVERR